MKLQEDQIAEGDCESEGTFLSKITTWTDRKDSRDPGNAEFVVPPRAKPGRFFNPLRGQGLLKLARKQERTLNSIADLHRCRHEGQSRRS